MPGSVGPGPGNGARSGSGEGSSGSDGLFGGNSGCGGCGTGSSGPGKFGSALRHSFIGFLKSICVVSISACLGSTIRTSPYSHIRARKLLSTRNARLPYVICGIAFEREADNLEVHRRPCPLWGVTAHGSPRGPLQFDLLGSYPWPPDVPAWSR